MLDAIRDILSGDGRTLAQGALAWLLARGDRGADRGPGRAERGSDRDGAAPRRGHGGA
jgi:hypothetical protein